MRNWIFATAALLALSGCATGPASETADLPTPKTAQEALRPYYAGLQSKLPVAASNPALAADTVLTRIAFGSCQNENRSMAFWDIIAAQKPQAFLLIGDNVYGDTGATWSADIPTLAASYRKLSTRQEWDRFRRSVPMLTTWDDHDFGANDAGGSFAFKEQAERLYESYWGASDEVKSRPGIYESRIVGPEGKRVQLILLDTRFFRSDLVRMPYRDPGPALGWYLPNVDPKATLLGEAQWQWLEGELAKPAELRFIASSTQVVTSAHNFEGWTNFPKERERLYRLLAQKGVNNALLLSGDRHAAGFYKADVPGLSKPLWDFTSSSLNFAFGKGDNGDREPDPARTGGFWGIPNFGQIDIDWNARKVKLSLRKDDGSLIEEQVISPFG
ncbi:MAG: alkaline phosphatase family protein [Sphingomonadales bacterium]|nr:alkaline phosphatase family protein [Sphingomonadales bacterium]MBK9267859.1 alkaline phosphatase family protein [Sphingomonadales bacterium]MBP6433900.1 alkaline phosphatase family protein [Sphingorhabdus sp.]